ncbi:hypothetical protein [Rhodoblastus sp.]|uniref:hypothetical protein n=1 Tax=Rhodoblastus sp. TaxID=1962975 RepID=UPI003F9A185B
MSGSEMSVSMILKLVDQLTGPARAAESELQKLKGAAQALNDVQAGSASSAAAAADGIVASNEKIVTSEQRTLAAIEKSAAEQAAAIEGLENQRQKWLQRRARADEATALIAANEKIAQSERETAAATEKSAAQQGAAIEGLQRQRVRASEWVAQQQAQARQNAGGPGGGGAGGAAGGAPAGAGGGGIIGSMVEMGVGNKILHATTRAIVAGAEYQREEARLRVAGIPASELAEANRQARELSAKNPNIGWREALEEYRVLRSVASNPSEVPGLMPVAVQAMSALKAAGLSTENMGAIYKSAETMGVTRDPERFKRFIDFFVRSQQYAGHTLSADSVLAFSQQMKGAAALLSDRFLDRTMFLLAQETGSRGGAGLAGMMHAMLGNIHRDAADEWQRLGFLKPEDRALDSKGHLAGVKSGHHLKDYLMGVQDPDLFVWNRLKPALEKAGFTSLPDQIAEINKLYPNTRAAAIVTKLLQQQQQFETHQANLESVEGLAGAQDMMNTAAGGLQTLTTQLGNFATALTGPDMAAAGKALNGLATAVGWAAKELGQFDNDHPIAAMGTATAGIGAAFFAGGALLKKGMTGFFGGFGLKGSAAALDQSAAALTAAAARLGGAPGGLPDAIKKGGLNPEKVPLGLTVPAAITTAGALAALGVAAAAVANIVLYGVMRGLKAAGAIDDTKPNATRGAIAANQHLLDLLQQEQEANSPYAHHWRPPTRGGAPALAQVDNSKLDETKDKAESAKQTLDLLNGTVQPKVDLTGLERLVALVERANAGLKQLGTFSPSHSFAPSTGALHDGPEAR